MLRTQLNSGRLVTLEQPQRLVQPLLLFLMGLGVRPSELSAIHTRLVNETNHGVLQSTHVENTDIHYAVHLS